MAEAVQVFCIGDEPKSGLARDLGDCLQSRNVPFGTSGDSYGIDNQIAVNYRKDVSCRIPAGSCWIAERTRCVTHKGML